jgi:hypothetical protein
MSIFYEVRNRIVGKDYVMYENFIVAQIKPFIPNSIQAFLCVGND